MEPLIADSVSRLLLKFEKAADSRKSVDVFEYFGRYTMEVILASAFGRYKDIQSTEERDKLTDSADAIFGSTRDSSKLNGAVVRKWLCECTHVHLCFKALLTFHQVTLWICHLLPFPEGNVFLCNIISCMYNTITTERVGSSIPASQQG